MQESIARQWFFVASDCTLGAPAIQLKYVSQAVGGCRGWGIIVAMLVQLRSGQLFPDDTHIAVHGGNTVRQSRRKGAEGGER